MATYERLEMIYPALLDAAQTRILKAIVPSAGTITRAYLTVNTGPTHGDVTFDINISGASIFSNPTDRPKILNGQTTAVLTALNVAVAEGNELTIDLDVINAADMIGLDLTVIVSVQVAATRLTATYTTASLAANAVETGLLACARSVKLISVLATADCWLRLYLAAAYRTADAGRSQSSPPSGQHGCWLDIVLAANTKWNLVCEALASNTESPPVASFPLSVKNLSGGTTAITITAEYIPEEA